jgi:hypothetical protein
VRFIDPSLGTTKNGQPARIVEAVWIPEWSRWASLNYNGSASLWIDEAFHKRFVSEAEWERPGQQALEAQP